jgi:type I restriction enzyme S subunit
VSNPKGWEIYNFGKVVLNKDSKRVPIKSADRDLINGIYPYYGASGIIDYVDDFVFEEENLLIGEDGANLITRNSPIAFIASGNYWVNNHAHVLGFNGVALLIYLKYFINSINLEPYITGSAQPKLNRGNMDKIKVSIPPLLLQNQFAERVAVIEQQKAIAQASLDKSEELFNSLLHKAFKGELV